MYPPTSFRAARKKSRRNLRADQAVFIINVALFAMFFSLFPINQFTHVWILFRAYADETIDLSSTVGLTGAQSGQINSFIKNLEC